MTQLRKGEAGPLVDITGGAPSQLATSLTFNHVNGLQSFVVAVPGIEPGMSSWVSLDGVPDPNTEVVGVQGCFTSGFDQVTVLAYYPGNQSSVSVPIRVFWLPPAA